MIAIAGVILLALLVLALLPYLLVAACFVLVLVPVPTLILTLVVLLGVLCWFYPGLLVPVGTIVLILIVSYYNAKAQQAQQDKPRKQP